MRVIIDGAPEDERTASISVFDWALIRGFGVFEVVRSYRGSLFRLERHLDRLASSAAALDIAMPNRIGVARDMNRVATACGEGQVRVILTGGGRDPSVAAVPRTVVMWEPLPVVPDRVRVLPVVAPWHPATDSSGYPGVKWTSYAPNMVSTDRARRLGYDDALLVTPEGVVLEGPTFTFAWVHRGRVETPSLDLGILPSITREVVIECCGRLALDVDEGRHPLDRVLAAEEVFALSTVKEVVPVEQIGETRIPGGLIAGRLAAAFAAVVREETQGPRLEPVA
ncbi:MAG: aminotransferase class IV family protein [Acidimicrobiia bacterium]|nr:aminotransferase class IV family protein [Acidimicrobiia bacterium]